MADPAVTYCFDLEIDGLELGTFTKVDGLTAKYETKAVVEGGENGFTHNLPGRITYDNIKLTRPLDMHSKDVIVWFTRLTRGPTGPRRGGAITAYGPNRKPIARWSLAGVFPVRYQGPSFDVSGSSVPTETLEIGHNGFVLEGAQVGPATPSAHVAPSALPALPRLPTAPAMPSAAPPAVPRVPTAPAMPSAARLVGG